MLYVLTLFFPVMLVLHGTSLFFFRSLYGAIATFFSTLIILFIFLIMSINLIFLLSRSGSYFYLDFGCWFFCYDIIDSHLVFCSDLLALISTTLVLFLTLIAFFFSVEYMFRDVFINRLLYLLNLFAVSVIILFFSYDFFLIIIAWELVGIYSFLLVNFYSMRIYSVKAAFKTFVFSRISDAAIFLFFIFIILIFNTSDLSLLFVQVPFFLFHKFHFGFINFYFIGFLAYLLIFAAVIKAAQFVFHVWLPDAMEAPTPASALIHSSTLVVIGIYIIIRFSIFFEFMHFANYVLALIGSITIAFGSVIACFQIDIKKLIAYSTISQIGYLICGCGFCCYEEVLVYLIVHAVNKAFLFMIVGYIVHFFLGNTDMRQMGGIFFYALDLWVICLIIIFNLSGLPYSSGFFSKEFFFFQITHDDLLSVFVRCCWLVSFLFTPLYLFYFLYVVIFCVKKGPWAAYFNPLKTKFLNVNSKLFTFSKYSNKEICYLLIFNYQNTIINSRIAIFVYFSFILIINFFGESLVLLLVSIISPIKIIFSPQFFSIEIHIFFQIIALSKLLSSYIFYLVIFFAFWNIIDFYFFLLYKTYRSLRYEFFNELFIFSFIFILIIELFFFEHIKFFIYETYKFICYFFSPDICVIYQV